MRTLFRELRLASIGQGVATLDVLDQSFAAVAQGRREHIAEIFQRVMGAAVRVELALPEDDTPAQDASRPIDDTVMNDPIVRQAQDLFGGTIISVEQDATG